MITSTNLSMLRNLEHFQVMSNVLAYLKGENLEELKLTSLAETFETKLRVYDEVLVLERGNVLSGKISQADAERDNALKALLNVVKAYTLFPESEKADAALKLLHVIEKYGKGIDRLPYLQESGVLSNLLQDLDTEENAAAAGLLHLEDWVNKLKEAAGRFDVLFVSREADNSTKLSGKVKEARQAVQAEFEQLALLVNACEVVYGAEPYGTLTGKINEAVDYARQQATRRGVRPKSGEAPVTE
ncbi:MAG: DUF6261 family protein [Odoribacter splanchnicus]